MPGLNDGVRSLASVLWSKRCLLYSTTDEGHCCLVVFALLALLALPLLVPRFALTLTAVPYEKQRGSGTVADHVGYTRDKLTPCRNLHCVWMMLKKSHIMIVSQESRAEGQSSCGEKGECCEDTVQGEAGFGREWISNHPDWMFGSSLVAAVNLRSVDPCAQAYL